MNMNSDQRASQPEGYPQTRLLAFRDQSLEERYLTREYVEHRTIMAVAAAGTALLLLAFVFADPWLLPEPALARFRQIRIWVLCPLGLFALAMVFTVRQARVWIASATAMVMVLGMTWAWMLTIGGTSVFEYLSLALMQTIVGIFFLLGLPMRRATSIVAVLCTLFIATAAHSGVPSGEILKFGAGYITLGLMGAVGAYRAEKASRSQFVMKLRSEAEYAARLAVESDRNRWLSVIAHFFRHELRNAMAGVRTSLEMAQRRNCDPEAGLFLERGRRSVDFMRELLTQAANATTLESALSTQELEPINLSEIVAARIEGFNAAQSERNIEMRAAADLWIRGHADRWIQLMDKLLDNALEHGRADYPIRVACYPEGTDAVLSIENRGDALPSDTDSIFDQFVSGKRGSQNAGNLGLGLFVARVIASRHHGTISVVPLEEPTGARFIVRVPLLISDLQTSQ